jgi:predicted amidohydrolase
MSDRKLLSGLKKTYKELPGRNGFCAQDNALFAVFANQVGYNGHSTHSGGAYVLSPRPEVLAKAQPVNEDLWISAELDPDVLDASRGRATLRNRRPEVYGEITRMI